MKLTMNKNNTATTGNKLKLYWINRNFPVYRFDVKLN